ncbi:MAG: adenylyltransferase/cytidyltransferase family protein [Nitrospinae bacterium]|nr:adenylyltransferase/cytidyltransferase family protein [Nitrospinota bacterium]
MNHRDKIKTLAELAETAQSARAGGKKVVYCHGVFDLLHIGHIKHLEAARRLGDILIVTVTPDRFVNKGPHRPAFPEMLRAEALAAMGCVDWVGVNNWPTAVEPINIIKPDLFVKGIVRGEGKRDHSDAIDQEENAIRGVGGNMVFTDEETYSASTLINRFMDIFTPEAKLFLEDFRSRHTPEEIIGHIQKINQLKVLTIGETIIDEYHFCAALGKANKEPILAVRNLYKETYAGGILAIANHVSGFCGQVGLMSMIGEVDSFEDFVHGKLYPNVTPMFLRQRGKPTLVKRRFVESYSGSKLFEVYIMENGKINGELEEAFCASLEEELPKYDVVVVADYGHGLFTDRSIKILAEKAKFLAVNTQTNAGNMGFNMISKYPRADFISIAEPEIRLDSRDMSGDLKKLVERAAKNSNCGRMVVTKGKNGCLCYDETTGFCEIPAFSVKMVDRIGSGDAVLALTAPCVTLGLPMEVVGFIGNVAGAEACAIMGNKTPIEPSSLFRHITSLMK